MNVDPGPQTSFQGPQKRLKERRRTMVQWRKDDILRPLSVTILFLTSSPTPILARIPWEVVLAGISSSTEDSSPSLSTSTLLI